MRTTISLDDELLRQAKSLASGTNRTLSAVIADALREALARRDAPAEAPVDLPTFGGGGVAPGFDLNDPSSWADFLDEEEVAYWRERQTRATG